MFCVRLFSVAGILFEGSGVFGELGSDIESAMAITDRSERNQKQSELEGQAVEKFLDEEDENTKQLN